ncbi:MAG: dsDNA nuclease domain-containing protein [Alphaproteobacteria bacterium]
MTELWQVLLTAPEPENAGARTGSRIEFQVNWSLKLAIDNYDKEENFLVVPEFHDDVCFIDDEDNPQNLDFYQVKGKRGNEWTISKLTEVKKNKDDNTSKESIVGKLLHHKENFPNNIRKLTFVSNMQCEFHNSDCVNVSMHISKIKDEDFKKLKDNLEKKSNIKLDKAEKLYFEYTDLSLEGSRTHLKGIFSEFISKYIPKGIDTSSLFDMFLSELSKKAREYTEKNKESVEIFKEKK